METGVTASRLLWLLFFLQQLSSLAASRLS
jgi:hypothetical protein